MVNSKEVLDIVIFEKCFLISEVISSLNILQLFKHEIQMFVNAVLLKFNSLFQIYISTNEERWTN